jgi:hypothetical protein
MADENKGGRPLKFKSVKELQMQIDNYFESCDEKGRPYTTTGLALALDTNRHTLLDYEEKDGFSHTIKKAKLKIENYAEEALYTSKQTAGVIFNLVNNHKWINKQDITQNGTMNNNNINSDITNLAPDERRLRIDELNRRRGNGTDNAS